jgi:glycine cleavage system H protein
MNKVLNGLHYAKSHEWVKVEGTVATIGITDYAQHSLGNIVYLEAKEVGEDVKQFVEFGTIESVKAASDVMAPLSGEIIERNEDVIDAPEVINEDPYGAWIIKIEVKDLKELANLLTADEYQLESK